MGMFKAIPCPLITTGRLVKEGESSPADAINIRAQEWPQSFWQKARVVLVNCSKKFARAEPVKFCTNGNNGRMMARKQLKLTIGMHCSGNIQDPIRKGMKNPEKRNVSMYHEKCNIPSLHTSQYLGLAEKWFWYDSSAIGRKSRLIILPMRNTDLPLA